MSKKDAKNVISSYRKKQKMGPYILGGLAILLVVVGIVLLVVYLIGGGSGLKPSFLNSPTPFRDANANAVSSDLPNTDDQQYPHADIDQYSFGSY